MQAGGGGADPRAEKPAEGPQAMAPGVWRLTAPNPSPMTFQGTQTYLVGPAKGAGPIAVIDPGPASARHRAAILAAVPPGSRIAAILVTHSHVDHSTGVPALAAATGAPVYAFGPHGSGMSATMQALAAASPALGGGEGADRAFAPDRRLADGEVLALDGVPIAALHTPGHLSNHLSFALVDRALLFTGDAAMGWSTTLVSPPEGDMAEQVRTLDRLERAARAMSAPVLLPGHGPAVPDPLRLIAEHRAHRAARRASILAALADGPADAASLARRLYTDTPPALMGAAARNVLATLLQLMEEGAAEPAGPLAADVAFRAV